VTGLAGLAVESRGRHYRAMGLKEGERDSSDWLRGLNAEGPAREEAVTRLRALLLQVARSEAARRSASLPERGREEVDDLCHQAASDAAMAILRKLPEFRGDSRFTTWACKFALFEISTRLRRHAWRHRRIDLDEQVWDRLADSAPLALTRLEHTETLHSLQRAIRDDLTDRQRLIFQAAVLDEVPIDVLAERLDSTRGAIYKILHDSRARLRQAIARSEGKEERV
jgi:RNA polymerase sigma-70 factor (ECF subfamily)